MQEWIKKVNDVIYINKFLLRYREVKLTRLSLFTSLNFSIVSPVVGILQIIQLFIKLLRLAYIVEKLIIIIVVIWTIKQLLN